MTPQQIIQYRVKSRKEHLEFVNEMLRDKTISPILFQKRKEYQRRLKREKNALETAYKLQVKAQDWSYDNLFAKMCIMVFKERIKSTEKHIKRLTYQRKRILNKDKPEKQNEIDLEAVKQIPINTLINTPCQHKTQQRSKYKCPIHNEKTPSFVVYLEQNRWYCFGACGEGGDVIDLYQKLHNIDFREALQELSKQI